MAQKKTYMVPCPYCDRPMNLQKLGLHTSGCYWNDTNVLKIGRFLRDYTLKHSTLRRIVRYPQMKAWNDFSTQENMLHLRAGIQSFDPDSTYEEMIDRILVYGIRNNIIQFEDYPPFLRYSAHPRQFYTEAEWVWRLERGDVIEKALYDY